MIVLAIILACTALIGAVIALAFLAIILGGGD